MSRYDAIAQWYDQWVSPTMDEDPFFPALEALLGEVAGRDICDLACGQGRLSRHLADAGARVVGIDLSRPLLAIAERHETERPRGIRYMHDDAQQIASVADDSFDGVVCNLALMDIAELAPTLAAVSRILRAGGGFTFSVLHPCFNTELSGETQIDDSLYRTIAGYFREGFWRSDTRSGPPGRVGAYHRTLSTYVNALTDAGFVVERMDESPAVGEFARSRPIWMEVPAVLTVRSRRRG